MEEEQVPVLYMGHENVEETRRHLVLPANMETSFPTVAEAYDYVYENGLEVTVRGLVALVVPRARRPGDKDTISKRELELLVGSAPKP